MYCHEPPLSSGKHGNKAQPFRPEGIGLAKGHRHFDVNKGFAASVKTPNTRLGTTSYWAIDSALSCFELHLDTSPPRYLGMPFLEVEAARISKVESTSSMVIR